MKKMNSMHTRSHSFLFSLARNFSKRKQVYTVPTYDSAFKYILSNDIIRSSFFHAFIPGTVIKNSTRIDEHMNPIEKLQLLRKFIKAKHSKDVVKEIQKGNYKVVKEVSGEKMVTDLEYSTFFREFVGFFDEISGSFPEQLYDGKMDFACQLDNGEYALVKMQVIPEDYWDRRALAYISAFYGSQLRKGDKWKDLRKVIGINILGGGKNDKLFWADSDPNEYMRHYKFQNQIFGYNDRYIDGVELFQYSIMRAPPMNDIEVKDWHIFFSRAAHMTEDDVTREITTPEVLQAFERAKIAHLPTEVLVAYEAEEKKFDLYSQHTASLILEGKSEGKIEGKLEVAKKMLSLGFDDQTIVKCTGFSVIEIDKIRRTSN